MESGDATTLLRTLDLVRRRGWIVLVVAGISTMLATFIAFAQPRFYRSEATIEVGPDQPQVSPYLFGEPMGASPALWENHFRTQESLLRRPGLLAKVLEALPPATVADYQRAPDPVRKLSEDLNIDAIPSSFLIRITLDHPTAERGPEIVNKLVALFLEDSNRRLRELKTGALEILSTEALPVIRQKVDESEQKLQAFHANIGFADLEGQYAALLEAKKKLWDRLSELRIRRISIRHHPGPIPEAADDGTADEPDDGPMSLESLVARRTELEVELAKQTVALKEKHPAVAALRAQLAAVQGLIRKAAKAEVRAREREIAAVDQEEKDLLGHEKDLDQQISESRVRLSDFKKLEAEVAASRELYSSYLKKQGEVKATSGAGQTSVRVVDLARTPHGTVRRTGLFLALGAIVGLLLGALAMLLVEQIDDRIATPRQAEVSLGLDLLATIPRMASSGTRNQPLLPDDDPVHAPLEAFRQLRTEVVTRLQATPGSKIVAVLSPGYGEGKSTIAVNLARVLALEGRRVLVLDADLRRPRLKGLLADWNGPGLEELLRGAPLERVIQPTRIPGVHVLGAGRELPGSAEAPGSPRMRDVWTAVRAHFDFTIVDTSPVQAASEVIVVAGQADASILVVEERRSRLRPSLAAVRRLQNHQIRMLGMVVNRSFAPVSRRPWREWLSGKLETVEGRRDALAAVR